MAKKKTMKTKWRPGDMVELTVTDLTRTGEGVGHVDGATVFVDGAVPGDRLSVRLTVIKEQYVVGETAAMLEASAHRVEPACAYYPQCGGCQWLHVDYPFQLELKGSMVAGHLQRIGHIEGARELVRPVLRMDEPVHYRNKAQYKASRAGLGFYRKGTHGVIPIGECLNQEEPVAAINQACQQWLEESGLRVYNEKTGKGCLRGVLQRSNRAGEVLVTLIVKEAAGIDQKAVAALFRREVPQLASLYLNVNGSRGNRVLGQEMIRLWGKDELTEELCGCSFQVSPVSFFQVNTSQAAVLYQQAIIAAGLDGTQRVADLYCGTGTIGICLAAHAREVVGIESVPEAVEDARANARLNHVDNIRFHCGTAEKVLPLLMEKGFVPDVVVLDPPRKGCARSLLAAIADCGIGQIVYVSCDSATLARDCGYLAERGYVLGYVQPVDLFPGTGHIETVALVTKKVE